VATDSKPGTEAFLVPFEDPAARLAGLFGAGLLIGTGAIHLDLYLTGYRLIPTIGWMFLLQVIAAFALGLSVIGVSVIPIGSRVALPRDVTLPQAVYGSGALFALATLAGYLFSVAFGLFGFKELRTTAGIVAGIIEICAFLLLGYSATAGLQGAAKKGAALGPLAVVAAVLLVIAEAGAATVAASSTGPVHSSGPEITIVIKNFHFVPDDPVVSPGERIVVTDMDSVSHTFSTNPGAPTARAFTTGLIPPSGGSRVVLAPRLPGRYPFLCLVHTFMTGVLTVR
jgi:plastocyanin